MLDTANVNFIAGEEFNDCSGKVKRIKFSEGCQVNSDKDCEIGVSAAYPKFNYSLERRGV